MNIAIFARYVEEDRVTYTDKKYTITGAFEPIAERCGFSLIPILPSTDIDTLLKVADGIIIPGCRTDVDPKHYNAPLDPHTYNKVRSLFITEHPEDFRVRIGLRIVKVSPVCRFADSDVILILDLLEEGLFEGLTHGNAHKRRISSGEGFLFFSESYRECHLITGNV